MQGAIPIPPEIPEHVQVAQIPLPAMIFNMHILFHVDIVHKSKYARSIYAFVLLRANLLDALTVYIRDIGASVDESCLDFMFSQQTLLGVLAPGAVVDELAVTLLGDEVVVLQVLHCVGRVLEVGVALVGDRAGVLQ